MAVFLQDWKGKKLLFRNSNWCRTGYREISSNIQLISKSTIFNINITQKPAKNSKIKKKTARFRYILPRFMLHGNCMFSQLIVIPAQAGISSLSNETKVWLRGQRFLPSQEGRTLPSQEGRTLPSQEGRTLPSRMTNLLIE